MATKAKFYLGERHNPQLAKVYFMKLVQKSIKDAKKYESGYGSVYLLAYDNEEAYQKAILEKQAEGYRVH